MNMYHICIHLNIYTIIHAYPANLTFSVGGRSSAL